MEKCKAHGHENQPHKPGFALDGDCVRKSCLFCGTWLEPEINPEKEFEMLVSCI